MNFLDDRLPPNFWSKAIPEPNSGCWLWTGTRNESGYGMFGARGNRLRAHRVAFERLVGAIPDGLVIDHLCRERSCVNPSHMEPVTIGENVKRGGPSRRTHCPRGHAYDIVRHNGSRGCSACQKWHNDKRYEPGGIFHGRKRQ